ncbi:HAD superfamily hydrolase (TIGR01549 family) [Halomonas campaniensis]|uniref:phosphoglycolate phosphatase n=1 Tax=Halomonas campaniensis TaxID=213554 RepID=A0A7W5K4A5_9GAMM|nr:HAD-IA family hydrolase [Halomonas campaniensis]MBB3331674.1 HAD superfamily hydrolase (TIGR01549 family) [Halomonas campaniensis]
MSDDIATSGYALVFDFDGVVLDSATLKRQAFADLYRDEPEERRRSVVAYLSRRGGQPREVKFRHIEAHILGRKASEESIRELCERFKASVEKRLLEAPAIPGALEFLERWQGRLPLYLLSATPEHELRTIVERRDLTRYFLEVVGSPPDKVTGLRNLLARREHAAQDTVMIGDSYNDYRAARSNGTRFIGITADPAASPFPDDVVTAVDLTGLELALTKL